jgi:phage/plasmid-associated DNA primase
MWPVQGPTLWGDVKSNGFSQYECVHHSGMRYKGVNAWTWATPGLMTALADDRIFPQGHGATGAEAGPWASDDYRVASHNEAVATVASMVRADLGDEEICARLEVIMPNREGDWPERGAYIAEKISSARRKSEKWDKEEENFWGYAHPDGYPGLVAELQRRFTDNIERATPGAVALDSAEWIEHRIAEGVNLKHTPLELRLNPQQRPVEPRSKSDKGNANDILEAGLYVFRFAADEGSWLRNTGNCWEAWGTKSDKAEIGRAIASAYGTYLKTTEMLDQELALQGTAASDLQIAADDARRKRLLENQSKYNNSGGQSSISTALVTEARRAERYSVYIGELDSEPDVLWAGGYPWSLRHEALSLASDFRDVNPVHLKTAACGPWPGETPAWDQVLEAVWPDERIRAWALREIAGVALWGGTSKMHPVLDGPPQGGKSTFALILKMVLGSYAVQVSPDKILGGEQNAAHDEEIAAMMGARLVWMDEPPPPGKQAISRFNDLASGTGELSAARKYQNRITAPKLFNFLICQNSRNALRMDAQGVGERMTFIPCHGEPAVTLEAWKQWKLKGEAEYPAVLAALIRECALFHSASRPEVPMEALMARGSAQERSDEFAAWVLDNYEQYPGDVQTNDPRLDESPTVGSLRTQYNATYAQPNRQSAIGAEEAHDQLLRTGIRVATGGHKRRKHVVFVHAKAVAFGSSGRY